MSLLGLSSDTLLGAGLGAVAVYYLWNKLDDWSDAPAPPRSDRKFAEDDLGMYNGAENRLLYVGVGDEVFDCSRDKASLASALGGKRHESFAAAGVADEAAFRSKYPKVGNVVILRNFSKAQLAAFDGRDGRPVYICAKGVVYEVDKNFYGPDGPYGIMAGKDASRALALVSLDPADIENSSIDDLGWNDLNTLEEWVARLEMKYQKMGYLVDEATGEAPAAPPLPTFLNKERQQVTLAEKISLSHDTRLFRFALPDPKSRLGLPIGKHIKFWCPNPAPVKAGEWNGREDPEAGKKEIERKYTPSSLDVERDGAFDVVIKVYARGVVDRFPDGGKLSQYLDSLKIGDTVDLAGPYGLNEYKGRGKLSVRKKERDVKFVGMLAGGTGITPMLQLIKAVLRDPKDETKLSLLFANQTEDDILVRDMLEDLAAKHPDRFKLNYTLDRPPKDWKYSTGFITAEMIQQHLPPPGPGVAILMCGPPPMVKFACKANLDKLGYSKECQIEF